MSAGASFPKMQLSTRELDALVRAIDRRLIRGPLEEENLAAGGLAHLTPRLGPLQGLPPEVAHALAASILAERERKEGPHVDLVWTGPEAISSTARDTATVVRELFSRARRCVLVAGYSFDHGAEIFEALHDAMKLHGVEAELFVNIPRPKHRGDPRTVVRKWEESFFLENWRFPTRPTIYFDPRDVSHEEYSSLHAKCLVVDERFTLVTSANFTDRGQGRNIEVGAYIDDARFGRSLVEQWRMALTAGVFLELGSYLGVARNVIPD